MTPQNRSTRPRFERRWAVAVLGVALAVVAFPGGVTAQEVEPESRPVPPASSVNFLTGFEQVVTEAAPLGGANIQANQDTTTRAQNETTIAVNEFMNPFNLVGGANDYRAGETACGYYSSFDRGLTWPGDGTLPLVSGFNAAGDPAVAFDAQGRTFYLCMHFTRNASPSDNTQYVHRSLDGGLTWQTPVLSLGTQAGNFDDKGHLAVDTSPLSPYVGNVYVSVTRINTNRIRFNRSTNAGASFDGCPGACADQAINDAFATRAASGSNIVVGPTGIVWVAWWDVDGSSNSRIVVDRSDDGGATFGTDYVIRNNFLGIGGGVRPLGRVNSFPVIQADPTDEDIIYAVWPEDPDGTAGSGDDSDILFSRCEYDSGGPSLTCTTPERVNEDINPAGDFHSQFFPWMSVDPVDGSINVVWYDDRNDPDRTDGTPLVDLYFASSTDGGNSFSQNLRVSDQSSDVTVNFMTPFFGDYNAIDSYDGIAYPLWADSRNGDQDVFVTQVGGADLSISKNAPSEGTAGDLLTYDITVHNAGPAAAFDVTVTDTLPAGTTFYGSTDSCTDGGGPVTCNVGNIAPGDSESFTLTVEIDSGVAQGTTLTNTAEVESAQDDPDPGNNTDSDSTVVLVEADLRVTKTCKPDRPLTAGSTANCTILIDNLGPSSASDVELTDILVSNGDFTVSNIDSSQGTCNLLAGPPKSIECAIGTVDAGDRATVTYDVTADDEVDVNDVATVSSSTPDPDTSNNQDEASISFTADADLSLAKMAPATVVAGTSLTYDLVVTNDGPSTAVNVVIADTLPADVAITSVTSSVGTCNAGVPGDPTRPTTCAFDSIPYGGSRTMTVIVAVSPQATGLLINDAVVSSDTGDSNNANDLATTTTTVLTEADLSVTKTVITPPGAVLAGDDISYQLTVMNAGPSTARMVQLSDTLPAELDYMAHQILEGTGDCTLLSEQPDVFACSFGDLDPGDRVRLTLTAHVFSSVPQGTMIANTATAGSTTTDPDASNNSSTTNTTVDTAADIWMEKSSNFPTGNASGTIIYYLTVHNEPGCTATDPQVCGTGGPSDARNIVVTDPLPLDPKKMRVQFVTPGCSYDRPSHTVTCQAAVVPYGVSVQFQIQVEVKGNAGPVLNTVSATTTTTDPDPTNNSDQLLLVVQGGTGNPGGPKPGRGGGGAESTEPVSTP